MVYYYKGVLCDKYIFTKIDFIKNERIIPDMKFGSVEFFKHLIISTVICVVIFAASFSMIFGIKASSESIRVADELPRTADAMADVQDTEIEAPNGETSTGEPPTAGNNDPPDEDEDEDEKDTPDSSGEKPVSVSGGFVIISKDATIDEVYDAIKEIGISSKELIDYISENDGAYLDELISEKASAEFLHTDAPAEDTPTPVVEAADDYPQLYAEGIDLSAKTDGTVCLSFEGIVPDYLSDIFYILDERDASAVFFLTCEEAESLSDSRLAAFAENGCTVGISLTGEGSLEEMNRAFERISSVTGQAPSAYICDGISPELEQELAGRGFVRFGGETVTGGSWTEVYTDALDKVEASENGAFLRLDGGYYSVITAEDIIGALKNDGYTFITM